MAPRGDGLITAVYCEVIDDLPVFRKPVFKGKPDLHAIGRLRIVDAFGNNLQSSVKISFANLGLGCNFRPKVFAGK
jgi:hypothetical protein